MNFQRHSWAGLWVLLVSTALGVHGLNFNHPAQLLLPPVGQASEPPNLEVDPVEAANVQVYQDAGPAVVSISTNNRVGSGSIISPDGLVLTNAHVVLGAKKVEVVLADGRVVPGEVVGFADAGLDLAAVQMQGQHDLPTVRLAAPDSVQVGQRAFTIGNSFGRFQGTFSTGIVSRIDPGQGLIQTNAKLHPGFSGGPLLNRNAELIGVVSGGLTTSEAQITDISLAIAPERVQSFLAAVRDGRAPRTAPQAPLFGGGREPAQRLTLNQAPVQGQLATKSDRLPSDNSYFDAYTFVGQAGQRVLIQMRSQELDSFLIVFSPEGLIVADDNSGGQSNASIDVVLPSSGIYTILANTHTAKEMGQYTLILGTD